jgi:hypothetical protein
MSIVERKNNKKSRADVQYFALLEQQLLHQRKKNYDNDCLRVDFPIAILCHSPFEE